MWLGAVLAATACGPVVPVYEICGNGLDDDGNGQADCADVNCKGKPECDCQVEAGHGPCVNCGACCTEQASCLQYTWGSDNPLPACLSGRCDANNMGIQFAVEADTQGTWNGVTIPIRAMSTRFVRKTALDGSAVTCATMATLAASKQAADADQIERSGKVNLLAFDVAGVSAQAGTIIRQPYVNVGTGQDYLVWLELWSGTRDSATKLPTGTRLGWGCFETGAEVDPILPEHHCATTNPLPTCRTMRLRMPGPQ